MRHVFPKVLAIPGLLALAALTLWSLEARSNHSAPGLSFTNIASQAGLKAVTIYGGEQANRYLVETTGCGVAQSQRLTARTGSAFWFPTSTTTGLFSPPGRKGSKSLWHSKR